MSGYTNRAGYVVTTDFTSATTTSGGGSAYAYAGDTTTVWTVVDTTGFNNVAAVAVAPPKRAIAQCPSCGELVECQLISERDGFTHGHLNGTATGWTCNEKPKPPKKCVCATQALMVQGCKCGGT